MRILTTLFLMLSLVTAFAKGTNDKKNEKKTTTLYMYGVSLSFNDSLVYVTDVQPVENACVTGKYVLYGAREYADQMTAYFEKKELGRRTNAVFYKKTRDKAEKSYMKLRKRYAKKGIVLTPIVTGDFTFKAIQPNE